MGSYQSWSVVFGEQPSAAKWNILGTNDSAFNDGSGIGTNAIAAASLATSAILLGRASATSDFVSSAAGPVAVTGLSASVTIPSGSRRTLILASFPGINVNAGAPHVGTAQIWDGTVGSGTQLSSRAIYLALNSNLLPVPALMADVAPTAGSKTYNVGLTIGSTNQKTLSMTSTSPGIIAVYAT
jgi:hypothetical protein